MPDAPSQKITIRCQFCQTWNRIEAARATDKPKCGKCGRPLLLDRPWPLNDESFERTVKETEVPVVVDVYADWCGPCKVMAPHIDTLAAKMQGKALVAKLNSDLSPVTAHKFDVRGIPTVLVFRGGSVAKRHTGAVGLAQLEALVA
ncbi:MAG TPA: thioredoxin domain-containing protein [Gemmatimonadaceae bacterium]|jgi:thioredoxin 2|nr:thioredoxin domain-containing protein [Gemmatimonadaceae bacterium]